MADGALAGLRVLDLSRDEPSAATSNFGALAGSSTGTAIRGASAGASEMIAAFGPYALVALALYAAFSDHSKFSLGSVATGKFDLSGLFQATNTDAPFAFGNNTEHDRPAALGNLLASAGASISAAAAVFGGSAAGLSLTANTDIDRDGQGAGLLALLLNGQRVAGVQTGTGAFAGNDPGNAAKIDAAQLSEFFANAVPTLIVEALQKSDLPQRFQDYFGSIDLQGLTTEKAQAIKAWAARQLKRVQDEIDEVEKNVRFGVGKYGEYDDRLTELYDLRLDLRLLDQKADDVLEGDASLKGFEGDPIKNSLQTADTAHALTPEEIKTFDKNKLGSAAPVSKDNEIVSTRIALRRMLGDKVKTLFEEIFPDMQGGADWNETKAIIRIATASSVPMMQRGSNPSRWRTSATQRPVTTAVGST